METDLEPESAPAATTAWEIGPGMGLGAFPYETLGGRLEFLRERAALRLLGARAFPSLSLAPLARRVFGLSSDAEVLERYRRSREGIEELWRSRSRETPADVEAFYAEHDADVWRQVYRSRWSASYKAKLLLQVRIVERLAGRRRDLAILDYGCGAGVLAHALLSRGFGRVHLADIPSATFDFCRKAFGERIRGYHEVGARSPLEGSYDLITCLDCLEHTVDPERIAGELVAALAPGGHLVVSYPLETDFAFTHTRAAAEARAGVMARLRRDLDEVLAERIFRHRGDTASHPASGTRH